MNHVHGGDVYRYKDYLDYSANCNPLGMPRGVEKAIADAIPFLEHYPDVHCEELTKALAVWEDISKEMIFCGNGAAEVIFSLCAAYKPGKALLLAPTFAEYEQALRAVDCEIVYHMLLEEDGFRPGAALEAALEREQPDIFFFCNPNNPTGILTKKEQLESMAAICNRLGILMVIDECFLDFVEKPLEFTMKEYLKVYKTLFIIKAFTKRYAMAGVRLGYGLSGSRKLLADMKEVTQPWNVSTLAQAAGVAALKEEAYVIEGRKLIFKERKYLKDCLKDLGYQVYGSQANYIFFRGDKSLWEELIKEKILIRDCGNYYGLEKGYYRIAVRTEKENQRLIAVLKKLGTNNTK